MNSGHRNTKELLEELASLRRRVSELEGLLTAERQAVESLRANEATYRDLYDEAPCAYSVVGPDARIRRLSQRAVELFGYAPQDVIGKPVFQLYADTPAGKQRAEELFRQFLGGKEIRGQAVELRRADGSCFWAELTIHPVRDADGNVLESHSMLVDITQRRQAEEALRASEELFRAVYESAPLGIAIVDRDGRPLRANRALRQILGYDDDELRNSRCASLTHSEDVDESERLLRELVDGKRDTYRLLKRYHRKDGTLVWGDTSVVAIRDQSGGFRYAVPLVEDVTERERAEETLRRSEERLKLSERLEALGRLAGGVAHDFNNVLTAIVANCEMLRMDRGQDSAVRECTEEIKKASERAASLTRQLLAFGRRQVLQPRVLDLNAVISDMEKLLRRLIGEDIELCMALDGALGRVTADPAQIEQVIMNLVVNARDAMPEGGKLVIETKNVDLIRPQMREHGVTMPAGPYVTVTVNDTGIGMDPETQARIFEPFFTTKERGKGTGLGLATVYGIVKQSGGYIWVYSEPGRGATFKIYLPRVEEPVEPLVRREQTGVRARGTETVLIVEGEPAIRKAGARVLRKIGYTVLEAGSAEEALPLVESHGRAIHLIVTDAVLPGLSGKELAARVHAKRPAIKILYTSGYAPAVIARHGVLEPGTAFLEKPFTIEDLARKVREVLDTPLA